MVPSAPRQHQGLVDLGRLLTQSNYRFITATPETHRIVNARQGNEEAHTLTDVFGWSRPFRADLLAPEILSYLRAASALITDGSMLRSAVRFSSIDDDLYVHSAYPTTGSDSVFFGPDTYRFVNLIRAEVVPRPGLQTIVDIGCGCGVGGIEAAKLIGNSPRVLLGDVNQSALSFAKVNVQLAGATNIECVASDVLSGVAGPVDLIVANPPYMIDPAARLYRDGGGRWGTDLSVRIVQEALERLRAGGQLLLYTGVPIVAGRDILRDQIERLVSGVGARFSYREIDPDVFGEELERSSYATVDRIAIIGLSLHME